MLEWGPKDVFAVPGCTTHRHVNTSKSGDAVLMSYTDEPAHRALGIFRKEHVDG